MATILVLERETRLRDAVCSVLIQNGYNVIRAGSIEEADRLCREHKEPIDLVIANDALIDGSGSQAVKRMLSCHPEAHVLRFSGFPRHYLIEEGTIGEDEPLLEKPFRSRELVDEVRRMLGNVGGSKSQRGGSGT